MARKSKGNPQQKLNALHEKLTDHFLKAIDSGEDVPVGVLKEIREFLKDNNVDCLAVECSPILKLAETLPFVPPDDSLAAAM